jgi:hypothetical protein
MDIRQQFPLLQISWLKIKTVLKTELQMTFKDSSININKKVVRTER